VFPDAAVEGVGAVALPVPPVAVVYHNSPVPVAVRAVAGSFWQYVTGVVTAGAIGRAFTVTATCELTVAAPSLTSTRYVVLTAGLTVGLAAVELKPAGSEVQMYV
jgi:hypothetical protein